jgi:serine/threonine protein kinase
MTTPQPDFRRQQQGDRGFPANSDHETPPFAETLAPCRPAPGEELCLVAGARVLPDYELVAPIGRGGYGEVWKAVGPGGFAVALKFIPLGDRSGEIELRSLEVMRNIRHPHLLSMFGAWQPDTHLIIAMELADRTLLDRFHEARKQGLAGLPRDELLEYLREAAKGIDFLNERRHPGSGGELAGIQHKDIKPENLLLVGGSVKVADFGLARLMEHTSTATSGTLTPSYAAPEIFKGLVTSSSDQYSLGVTYCQLRSGRLPFVGTPEQVMASHLMKPPDLAMLPEEERPAVARALAKVPEDRWPNCRAFVEALAAAGTEGQQELVPVTPRPSAHPVPTPEASSRMTDRLPPTQTPVRTERPPAIWKAVSPAPDRPSPTPVQEKVPGRGHKMLLAATFVTLGLFLPALSFWLTTGQQDRQEPGVAAEQKAGQPDSPGKVRPPVVGAAQNTLPTPHETTGASPALRLPPPGDVILEAGQGGTLTVRFERSHCPGPALFQLENVPPDIEVWPASAPADSAEGRMNLVVRRNKEMPAQAVRLRVQVGDVRAEQEFRLTVRPPRPAAEQLAEASAAARLRPDDPVAILNRGHAHLAAEDLTGAMDDYTEAIRLAPQDPVPHVFRSRVHIFGKQYDRAVEDCDEALRIAPGYAPAYRYRGLALSLKGDYDRAIVDLTEAIRLEPSCAIAYNHRGNAHAAKQEYDQAAEDYTQAIRLNPRYALAHLNRANSYARRGDHGRAWADFEQARQIDSSLQASYPKKWGPPLEDR